MRDAAASEAAELRRQLQHYEDLLEGRIRDGPARPSALVEARIAAHMTQGDLAQRVGVDEEQLVQWETDEFAGVAAERLRQIANALGIRLEGTVSYLPPAPPPSELRRRVRKAGVPRDLSAKIEHDVDTPDLAGVYARGFDWEIEDLIGGGPLEAAAPVPVAFKSRAQKTIKPSPLVRLAYTAARIVTTMATRPVGPLPTPDPRAIRAEAVDETGRVTLPSLLKWAWSRGLPVLPLVGAGGFSAAALKVGVRPVVVLKRSHAEAAYWLFDLAHELGHIAHDHLGAAGVVDVKAPLNDRRDTQEKEANSWALELLIPDHEHLIERVSNETGGDYMEFRKTIQKVAREENVSAGMLGFVAAYELSHIGEFKDRWGSATNVAKLEGEGRPLVEDALRQRAPIDALSRIDRQLMRAVLFAD